MLYLQYVPSSWSHPTKSQFYELKMEKYYDCPCWTKYFCIYCEKHIYGNDDSDCRDYCDKWIHKKCVNEEYKKLREKISNTEIWLCNSCLSFPFSNTINENSSSFCDFNNHFSSNDIIKTAFPICFRKSAEPSKGFPSDFCMFLI